MATAKKTPISSVNDSVISMEFDENPNIPTANYSEETSKNIKKAIIKKMRAEKLKKMIDAELKKEEKSRKSGENMGIGIPLTFKGM